MKKGKKLDKAATLAVHEEHDLTLHDLMIDDHFTQWAVCDHIVDHVVNKAMNSVRDKEIAKKVPLFSLISTMETIKNAIGMKDFIPDKRRDDAFIHADDGQEMPPPVKDSIGRECELNSSKVMTNKATMKVYQTLHNLQDTMNMVHGTLIAQPLRNYSPMSKGSKDSNTVKSNSRLSQAKNKDLEIDEGSKMQHKTTKRKMRRSDSEKRRAMEAKLLRYYQSLVREVDEWGPFHDPDETMLDGTQIDAQINKKRAHKNIMAEAFNSERRGRFKLSKKKKTQATKKKTDQDEKTQESTFDVNKHEHDTGYDGNGYILEDGNLIAIDGPSVDGVNKFALDVIKVQVKDHFDIQEEEEVEFNKLRGNLMNILEKNAAMKAKTN